MVLPQHFDARIGQAFEADRHRLRRQWQSIQQAERAGKPFDRSLRRLTDELDRSVALRLARIDGRPRVTFDAELPVAARREEIAAAIGRHQVLVVCGETGSGKSTQLPKICLDLGRGVEGMVGHTQPRRIAARAVAARLAQELGSPLGGDVGFKVRFTDTTNPRTYIKLMTDGILLAESQADRRLSRYDTIILDEAHERSLNIDFLLGFLKRLLPARPELKLIVTSATIDAERFARHFVDVAGEVPVIEVSGRTYPVEVRWRPLEPDPETGEPDTKRGLVQAVDELARIDRGDILIFLPTEQEIHAASKALRGRALPGDGGQARTQIVPLYARLSTAEQNKVFEPHSQRRIVLATNVAESSLTVPGIRYVIDTGTARISRYSSRLKVQRLPIEPVSQASADQRRGRCGRVAPGVCIRLFSEEDYQGRDRYTAPEIQRANLASVILQSKALGLGNVDEFPFLDPPRPESIRDGYKTLFELGAIDHDQELTDLGRALARLPVDPRFGRIILASQAEDCLHEVLIIASALAVQDPRERPADKQQAADECHARLADQESDFLTYLKLWDFYHELKARLSQNQLRKACRDQFLSFNRLREWLDVHRQLLKLLDQESMRPGERRSDSKAIHRALLTGFLSSVAQRNESNDYRVAGGQRAFLWPGSAAFHDRPRWVVAGEMVETSRRWLRTVARINPHWIEPLAPHLLEREYDEPHWDPAAGAAMCYERVTLFGLAIVPRRRAPLARFDPVRAREFFLLQGLVRADYQTRAKFLAHNIELMHELERTQRKSRRIDYLRGEDARYSFYDRRIPPEICDGPGFERWWRRAQHDEPHLLSMAPDDLLLPGGEVVDAKAYPDAITIRQMHLPLEYRFAPGSPHDGITLTVPQEGFQQLDPNQLEWLVPGLVEEKVAALLKSLPKPVRRHFVPIPDTVKHLLAELHFGQGCLPAAVAYLLTRLSGQQIRAEDFRPERLPDHLRMTIRVADSAGRTLATGRDLGEIRRRLLADAAGEARLLGDGPWGRDAVTSWDFGDLPNEVPLVRGGLRLTGYPMVVDAGASVALRLASTADEAARAHRSGVRRLYVLAHERELATQVSWLPNLNQWLLQASGLSGPDDLRRQLAELVAARAFLADDDVPRTAAAFEARRAAAAERIGLAVQDVMQLLGPLFDAYHRVRLALEQTIQPQAAYALTDIQEQLMHLTGGRFLVTTPWCCLLHLPRYLRAIRLRLEKIATGNLARDQQAHELVLPRWQSYLHLARQQAAQGLHDPQLERYRWLIEEYRVSLFAQTLGTSVPISDKRLDELWSQVGRV